MHFFLKKTLSWFQSRETQVNPTEKILSCGNPSWSTEAQTSPIDRRAHYRSKKRLFRRNPILLREAHTSPIYRWAHYSSKKRLSRGNPTQSRTLRRPRPSLLIIAVKNDYLVKPK